MTRKSDLEAHIRQSYQLVCEYEDIERLSEDPKERARAQRAIDEQWALLRGYLAEYVPLCERLNLAMSEDITEIAITAENKHFQLRFGQFQSCRKRDCSTMGGVE